MRRTITVLEMTALLLLGVLGGVGVAVAGPTAGPASSRPLRQSDGRTIATTTPTIKNPSARIDVEKLGRDLLGSFNSDIGAVLSVNAENVSLGRYTTFDKSSRIHVRIHTKTSPSNSPSGSYRLRVNLSNVAGDATLQVRQSNGQVVTCSVKQAPGYERVQACDVVLPSTGAAIVAEVRYAAGPANLTLDSVEALKLQ